MNFSPDTATTHVGWRQAGSDAADADHLLIRNDWSGSGDEPVLRFLSDEEAAGAPATGASAAANPAAYEIPAAEEANAELGAEVNDAAVDAPPYLWGGEALVPDSVSGPSETVFS